MKKAACLVDLMLPDIKTTNRKRYATINKDNVVTLKSPVTIQEPLTNMLRVGVQQLIQQAVEVELHELLSEHADSRTVEGKSGVVRNGHCLNESYRQGLAP